MKILLAVYLFFTYQTFSQNKINSKNDTLAIVGGKVITTFDFTTRIELMPYQGKENKQTINDRKKEIFYSLVAEKLLSNKFESYQENNDTTLKVQEEYLSNIFLRDALYRKLIPKNIEVTEKEILDNYKKFTEEYLVQFLVFFSNNDAKKTSNKLSKSKNLDSLINLLNGKDFVITDTILVTKGKLKKELEENIYRLKINGLTNPFKNEKNRFIVGRVLEIKLTSKVETINLFERKKWVENQIRGEKEDSLARKIFFDLLKNQHAKSDSILFYKFTDEVYNILLHDNFNDKKFELNSTHFFKLKTNLHEFLNEKILFYADKSITLSWLIEYLSGERIEFSEINQFSIQNIINQKIKIISQNLIMAEIAKNNNLFLDEDYKKDMSIWMDNYKYHFLLNKIKDTLNVSESDLIEYIKLNKNLLTDCNIKYRYAEIFSSDELIIKNILEQLTNKNKFDEFAKKYHRKELKNGISDFVDCYEKPESFILGLSKNTNEIIGPIKFKDGYSIIKILEVKEFNEKDYKVELKNISDIIRKQKINNYISELAKEQNIILFESKLNNVNISTLQMVTTRQIGFGGSILAFPMISPQFEWSKNYKNKSSVIP